MAICNNVTPVLSQKVVHEANDGIPRVVPDIVNNEPIL
jgi:hypothetical protein